MNARRSMAVGGGLILCLILGLFLSRPSVGQSPAVSRADTPGRYKMELNANKGGNITTVFVVDTQTGQCWYRDTSSDTKGWTDMGVPAAKGAH